jgi:lipopolysaccharide export system permease protein
MIYYAREGAVDPSGTSLLMKDGEVQRKTRDGNVSIIRFDSYSFDLSDLTENRGQATLRASDRDLGYLLNPDTTDKDYIARPGAYTAELHRRLTDWTLPFVFALISLVIAGDARSHRQARLHPMIGALSLSFALRWASFYAANEIDTRPTFIGILYGIPVVASVISIVFLNLHGRFSMTTGIGSVWLWIRTAASSYLPRKNGNSGGNA